MSQESPRLRKASHIGLWVIVIAIGGWLVWSATHGKNTTKNNTFASGSGGQTNIYKITKNYALASMDLALLPLTFHGCVRANKMENEPEKAMNEVIDAKVLVNAAINDSQP